jgi:hypothetical protein
MIPILPLWIRRQKYLRTTASFGNFSRRGRFEMRCGGNVACLLLCLMG